MAVSRIVALGGGGFSDASGLTPIDRLVLELAGGQRPRICFIGTASGDSERYAARFYRAFARHADASDLQLFDRGSHAIDELDDVDAVYVGGGSTANLLAVWRTHGVDVLLREAWARGTVLAGISAGAICWFDAGASDSFGPELRPVTDGLGILGGSFCSHYDQSSRRDDYRRLVAEGLPAGYGVADGVALVFQGTRLAEAVSEKPDAAAYRVDAATGDAREERLEVRVLSR